MSRIFVLANTKGGAGKSTISSMVIPALFADKEVFIYEIDNNNKSKIRDTKIKYKNLIPKDSEEHLFDIDYQAMLKDDSIHIIDVGGGDDTKAVLKSISEVGLENVEYLIPLNDDIEQVQNVINTIKLIDKRTAKSINVVFNRVYNREKIKEQFIGLFGDNEIGIKSRVKELKEVDEFFIVPNSTLFGILKNLKGVSLYDVIEPFDDLVSNIKIYRKEWLKNLSQEDYRNNMKNYMFAKRVINLTNELKENFKALK